MALNDIMDLEDQRRLNLTLTIRERIITGLTSSGEMPKGIEDRDFLMKALDGMDRTVLSKTKLKSDDKVANDQQANAKLIAEMLKKAVVKNSIPNKDRNLKLDDTIQVSDPIPGETAIGVFPGDYDEFMKNN